MANTSWVGVVGASSLVGDRLLRLLSASNRQILAFSRHHRVDDGSPNVSWLKLDGECLRDPEVKSSVVDDWVYVAPIWTIAHHFSLFEEFRARRIVAISSSSRFSKAVQQKFADPKENLIATKIAEAEEQFQAWAVGQNIDWVILRPTLIYGYGQDKNISEIARFVRRFRFFPLFGEALGLRQPIHADDVALAAMTALDCKKTIGKSFNVCGGETITYLEMVSRVFAAAALPERFVRMPLVVFRLAISLLRIFPRFRYWNAMMAARMNENLVFDCSDSVRELGLRPKKFCITKADLP